MYFSTITLHRVQLAYYFQRIARAYSTRDQTVRFTYVTSLRAEG